MVRSGGPSASTIALHDRRARAALLVDATIFVVKISENGI